MTSEATERAKTVKCPHCGAEPGKVCHGPQGYPYIAIVHQARRIAEWEQRTQKETK